ncbi:hypothetical protein PG984_015510 [Apiospora sp. TS-2023a]
MTSRYQPTGSERDVPEVFKYVCGHTAVGDENGLQRLFGVLMEHGFITYPKTACELTNHCPKCLEPAFVEAREPGTSKRRWADMLLNPLENAYTDETSYRMSVMVMFCDIWVLLNSKSLQPLYFSGEVVAHDISFAFRHWCWTLAKHIREQNNKEDGDRTRNQLIFVLDDLFGQLAAVDVIDLVDLYRRQPRELERMMPSDPGERVGEHRHCLRRWEKRVEGPHDYPFDASKEYNDLLKAASRWSSELLGPPQHRDLHREAFPYPLPPHPIYGPDEQAAMEKVMMDINDAAMRFRVQLYEMFKYAKNSGQIKDELEQMQIMALVAELEGCADFLRPLDKEKRRLWRLFVEFTTPQPHIFALATE